MLDPQQGDTFVLARTFGVEPGAVPVGAQVEVVDLINEEIAGVGGSGDRLIVRYSAPATTLDENGAPSEGVSVRFFALTAAELTALVEEDEETDNGG